MVKSHFWIMFFLFFTLIFSEGCKKSRQGHFSSRPDKQVRQKEKADRGNINDCEQLEKQREKKVRQAAKRKKQVTREAEEKQKEEQQSEKDKNKVPVQDFRKGSVKTGSSGIVSYLKIGAVVLLGLAAIGFVIGLVIFTLASIALSILLVPLLITFAWFVVAGVAYLGISLVNQIRRRRMRRRKRRRQREQDENPEEMNEEENENSGNGEGEPEK